jgi:hypothetical protein
MRAVNLALRFALELAAAAVWGRWMAPASRHRLADPARLLVEAAFFAAAGVALAAAGRWLLGAALTAVAVANAGLLRLLHHTEPSREGQP